MHRLRLLASPVGRPAGAALTLSLLLWSSVVAAAEFEIRPGKENQVVFESKAPVETVTGRTDQASGRVTADLENLGADVAMIVSVDLASLDTGIGLRNTHMRENHLHTDKHPRAIFRGARVLQASAPRLEPGGSAEIRLQGEFELHGVKRPLEAPVTLARNRDGTIDVATAFVVKLADFGIPRPKFLMMKLAEEQRISVRLRLHPVQAAAPTATGGPTEGGGT